MWRSRWRDAMSWGLVVLVLAALVLVAWATTDPGHPMIARAAEWPGVGPWVERFRVSYGVSEAEAPSMLAEDLAEDPGLDPHPEVEWVYRTEGEEPGADGGSDSPPSAAGRPEGSESPGAQPPPGEAPTGYRSSASTVWIAAGDALRAAPDEDAEVVGRADAFLQARVVERRDAWARVESTAGDGWVRAPEVGESYPMGSGVEPPRPLSGAPPPVDQIRIAEDLMGVQGPRGSLGPYPLYTDVEPLTRLVVLDRLAAQIEPAYVRRYGRRPEGTAQEAVLVFADPKSFRLFQSREARIRGIPTGGYARHGMLALWVGDRRPHELTSTLVHEVVHLLNRRALGPALPPWLDEGMAYDLGASRVGPAGDLEPAKLGGATDRRPGRVEYTGAVAGLRNLNASFAWDQPPLLADLTALEWNEFVRNDDRRELNYAHAGFFIRYLVDGEDGALAPAFRRFLARVADGAPPTGEVLRQELGKSWEELDRGLGDFVRDHILETTVEAQRLAG